MVSTREPGRTPGLIFLAPKGVHGQDGPMILDDRQRRPALTWWQGHLSRDEGRGEGAIYSENHRPLTRAER